MTTPDVNEVKRALKAAGVEVYRSRPQEVQIAERVRLHIMDSHVRVRLEDGLSVVFVARSQKSDFPQAQGDDLFERVRAGVGRLAASRGYVEAAARVQEVTDPVDDQKVLDVWHEVTFEKRADSLDEAVDEVRWALALEKYVRD